jgi:hypothetical protein
MRCRCTAANAARWGPGIKQLGGRIGELPGLQDMEQAHGRLLTAEPVAAAVHGVGPAPALAPAVEAIAVAVVAAEAPGADQQRRPAPAGEFPAALDISAGKGTAATPVMRSTRKALDRGGLEEPIRWGANGMALMAEPGGRARQQGIGSSETAIGGERSRLGLAVEPLRDGAWL